MTTPIHHRALPRTGTSPGSEGAPQRLEAEVLDGPVRGSTETLPRAYGPIDLDVVEVRSVPQEPHQ